MLLLAYLIRFVFIAFERHDEVNWTKIDKNNKGGCLSREDEGGWKGVSRIQRSPSSDEGN